MTASNRSSRIRLAAAALAAVVSLAANAEYLCNAPAAQEDKRACELAKQERPDALRHFIQTTAAIYGLYFYDYATPADFDRWDKVGRVEQAPLKVAVREDVPSKAQK